MTPQELDEKIQRIVKIINASYSESGDTSPSRRVIPPIVLAIFDGRFPKELTDLRRSSEGGETHKENR